MKRYNMINTVDRTTAAAVSRELLLRCWKMPPEGEPPAPEEEEHAAEEDAGTSQASETSRSAAPAAEDVGAIELREATTLETPRTLAETRLVPGTPRSELQVTEAELGNMALRAKQQRLKAEQDRQLLQNRINRLLIEQERACKRIAETRRRADEINALKKRNVASHNAKQDASQWMDSEQELQRQLLQANKQQRKKAIETSRAAIHQLRCEEVQVLKQMRKENEETVHVQRSIERGRAQVRKEQVREAQRQALERKQQEQQAALAKLRMDRESKRQQIGDDAETQRRQFAALAEEERRLRQSLQAWSKEQAEAYTNLEKERVASRQSSRGRDGTSVDEA